MAQLRRVTRDLWRSASARVAALRPGGSQFSFPQAPRAAAVPAELDLSKQVDEWTVLQDLGSSEVQRLLHEEAEATRAFFADAGNFEAQLQWEAARLLLPEAEAPAEEHGGFRYFQRFVPEGFVVFCREPSADEGGGSAVEVILDTSAVAREAGTGYADVAHCKVSDDHSTLAYVVDVEGDESYELRFATLGSGAEPCSWPLRLRGVRSVEFLGGGPVGASSAASSASVLTVHTHETTQRACRISHWQVSPDGAVGGEGRVLWEETDDAAYLEVFRTKDKQFILMSSNTKDTSEVRVIPCSGVCTGDGLAAAPTAAKAAEEQLEPKVLLARREGVEYFAEHRDGFFYVISNHERADFAVYRLPEAALGAADGGWPQLEPFFTPPGGTHITDADALAGWLVLYGHEAAEPRICVVPLANSGHARRLACEKGGAEVLCNASSPGSGPLMPYLAPLPASVGAVEPGTNLEPDSDVIRFTYRSPLEPAATYDLRLSTGQAQLVSRREWAPGVSPDLFVCERVEYPARDGERVPLTLLRPRHGSGDGAETGARPCLLHVYGAYGTCLAADFRPEHMALLRRGWVVAWAHVRGGGEKGRAWHIAARQLQKARSVSDLADAVKFLLARDIAAPGRLCVKAASAGGLSLGALLNSPGAAALVAAAILEVPFVDAMTGMLDPSLPLTVHEFAEWGDPRQEEHAANLRTLSPYENVGSHRYPPLYVSCALADARVPPWMALKYAARLRARMPGYFEDVGGGARRRGAPATASDNSTGALGVVLHCSDGGHGGAMDWHGRSEEFARQIIFLHKALGLPLG